MKQHLAQIRAARPTGAVLVYGPPKTGKTRSLGTLFKLPWVKRVAYFDFDGGDSIQPFVRTSLQVRPDLPDDAIVRFLYSPPKGDRIGTGARRPRVQGNDMFLSFLKDFNTLYDHVGADGTWSPKDPATWLPDVIVFDSITALQDLILDFILVQSGHDLGDKGTDARSDFGAQMQKLVEITTSVKGLPVLAVFIAHEKLIQNDLTGEVRIDPFVTGQLSAAYAREFGAVLYSQTKTKEHAIEFVWMTRPKGYIRSAGIRTRENLPLEIPQDFSVFLT